MALKTVLLGSTIATFLSLYHPWRVRRITGFASFT